MCINSTPWLAMIKCGYLQAALSRGDISLSYILLISATILSDTKFLEEILILSKLTLLKGAFKEDGENFSYENIPRKNRILFEDHSLHLTFPIKAHG